jgi:hypothetical protein
MHLIQRPDQRPREEQPRHNDRGKRLLRLRTLSRRQTRPPVDVVLPTLPKATRLRTVQPGVNDRTLLFLRRIRCWKMSYGRCFWQTFSAWSNIFG